MILEITRAGLASFSLFYLYLSYANYLLFKDYVANKQEKSDFYFRILFCIFSAVIALSEYIGTFIGNAFSSQYLFYTAYLSAILTTIFYALGMGPYYQTNKNTKKIIISLSIIALSLHLIFGILQVTMPDHFAYMEWETTDLKNILLHSVYGDMKMKVTAFMWLTTIIWITSQLILLISMIRGYVIKLYQDKIVLFGVILSILAVLQELLNSVFFYEYFFFIIFLANAPEIARITYLTERSFIQKKVESIKDKELEQLQREKNENENMLKYFKNITKGIAHEINTPLSIVHINTTILEKKIGTLQDISKEINSINKNLEKITSLIAIIYDVVDINFNEFKNINFIDCIDTFSNEIKNAGVKQLFLNLILKNKNNHFKIYASPLAIKSTILPLLTNILKFDDQKNVTLNLSQNFQENNLVLTVENIPQQYIKQNIVDIENGESEEVFALEYWLTQTSLNTLNGKLKIISENNISKIEIQIPLV